MIDARGPGIASLLLIWHPALGWVPERQVPAPEPAVAELPVELPPQFDPVFAAVLAMAADDLDDPLTTLLS